MRRARWKRKNVRRVGPRQRGPPAAGGGWLAVPCSSQGRKRPALGETSSPGRSGIHPASLFAAAGRWLMRAAAWANTTTSTTARAARSEAERAEREAGQMRSCNPMPSAPAPRESTVKSLRHPAAPVVQSSQTRRHPLTPTLAQQLCTHVQSCDQSGLFFWTVHGPFSFPQDGKENGGVHPRWTSPLREQTPPWPPFGGPSAPYTAERQAAPVQPARHPTARYSLIFLYNTQILLNIIQTVFVFGV